MSFCKPVVNDFTFEMKNWFLMMSHDISQNVNVSRVLINNHLKSQVLIQILGDFRL